MQANSELKAQMSVVNFPIAEDLPLGSHSASSLAGGGGGAPSALSLSVNVVTNIPATTSTVTTGTSTVGRVSAPVCFQSGQYLTTMETGLQ